MITNASSLTLTLKTLRQTFGLRLDSSDRFFDEWLNNAPTLTEAEVQGLDRLTRNYTYLRQEELPLEEIVKLVVVSPLLDLAGFYQFPFLVKIDSFIFLIHLSFVQCPKSNFSVSRNLFA